MIEPGIFRERFANGDTTIGSKYFGGSGWEDSREYRLYRDNKSGNIQYQDHLKTIWRTLAKYSFNPETLDWTYWMY